MASTLLVRMKIGSKLIDAKGIHHLHFKKQIAVGGGMGSRTGAGKGANAWISKVVSAVVIMTVAMSIGFMAAMWWHGSRNVEPAAITETEIVVPVEEDVHAFYYIDYNPRME
jgi:hypothetical protein